MPHFLVISSFLAGSNVGGSLAMKLLPQMGCEVSLLPTTLLGRHPGWGAPGGGAVPAELFSGMADGLVANEIPQRCDGVITGYFADTAQVTLAADLIAAHMKGRVPVIVDPIMGDEGKGLYLKPDVAELLCQTLYPLADVSTPNAWEAEELLRHAPKDAGMTYQFITSARQAGQIGIRAADGRFAGSEELAQSQVPNGTGDLATLLLAHKVLERGPEHVDLKAVIAQIKAQISRSDRGELCGLM